MNQRLNKAGAACLLASTLVLSGCNDPINDQKTTTIKTVKIITTEAKPFELTTELPGRIEPMRIAEVRARVTGIVLNRKFEEGSDVKAGQVLFEIDPAPFQAELLKAEGDLKKAQAQLFEAQALVKRYEPLVKIDAVSQKDFDTAMASYKRAEAEKQSASASLETARINLGYATVRAPISGRIGRANVTEGALVSQSDTTSMVIIQQLDPIYADFRQPVSQIIALKKSLTTGMLKDREQQVLPISLTLDDSEDHRVGKLLFADITVDKGTGQVSLRGVFPNGDDMLLPGMYVRVVVGQGIDPKAIMIPQRAIHRDTDGRAIVYLVAKDNIVEQRTVETGKMYGTEWHITRGLNSGEKVIVNGSVEPGQKVKPESLKKGQSTVAALPSSSKHA